MIFYFFCFISGYVFTKREKRTKSIKSIVDVVTQHAIFTNRLFRWEKKKRIHFLTNINIDHHKICEKKKIIKKSRIVSFSQNYMFA